MADWRFDNYCHPFSENQFRLKKEETLEVFCGVLNNNKQEPETSLLLGTLTRSKAGTATRSGKLIPSQPSPSVFFVLNDAPRYHRKCRHSLLCQSFICNIVYTHGVVRIEQARIEASRRKL
ncbi:hypothetical protein J6590_038788 [Homalodisca vitripennis]|nr:hypothetical protein J6590_038788 [Homalodisca vitripennis]